MKNFNTKTFITLLAITALIYSIYQLGMIGFNYYTNQNILAAAQEMYYMSEPKRKIKKELNIGSLEKKEEDIPVLLPYHLLLEANSDVVGWLRIENTEIDYPIVQASNNEYYLERNYKQEKHRAGSIFMDYRNDIRKENRHLILYGHNMKDGSMFGSLKHFLNEDFLKQNVIFSFETLYKSYTVEIFSVYQTLVDFNYLQTEFSSEQEYEAFLQKLQDKSQFELDVELERTTNIITLSTCDYTLDREDGRLVIHGVLK